MNIRKANSTDAKEISELIQNTLEKVNSAHYTKEQIQIWKKSDTVGKVLDRIKDEERYICVTIEAGKIVGVGSLKGNEVTAIYVKSTHIRKGVGSSLLAHLEKTAANKGIKTLTTDSSLTALNFYIKHGYTKIKDTFHSTEAGDLPCALLRKTLE